MKLAKYIVLFTAFLRMLINLPLYGVQNFIVADDSIVPVGMDGSPMATAYLIAANIADLLFTQGLLG
jgi:hypothetical protein